MKFIKYLFVLVVVATVTVNHFNNDNNPQYNSMEMLNTQALAGGEHHFTDYICVKPPRVLCLFSYDLMPLYGIRRLNQPQLL